VAVPSARTDAEWSRVATPDEHRAAGPDSGVVGTRRGSARQRHRSPRVLRGVVSPSAAIGPLSLILPSPDNHVRPGPYRTRAGAVDVPERRIDRVGRRPRIGERIVPSAGPPVIVAGLPAPYDHQRTGPDGHVADARGG